MTQHIHILGIGGTFMSALAILAREAGFVVTGNDLNGYPPVSELLKEKEIRWREGYDDDTDLLKADVVIVGNALNRGMPIVETLLNSGRPYTSGPQWLVEHILPGYRVIAVAGTHGKTTTTSMLAYIMDYAGFKPGFLIGGVAPDFNTSARLGEGEWFVIEADEYDSAFFDKRPKFMHYHPEMAVLNNLEFDHADIYDNLEAIQRQFHYFLKTMPGKGLVLKPKNDFALNQVLSKGCYCRVEEMACIQGADWFAELLEHSGQSFRLWQKDKPIAQVDWSLIGQFNVENAMAAMAASIHAGVEPSLAAEALQSFSPVKRRLEVTFQGHDITIYDDFAHHPTAILKTLLALKQSMRHKRVFIVLEFASYTMRKGIHASDLATAFKEADGVYILNPTDFSLEKTIALKHDIYHVLPTVAGLVEQVVTDIAPGDGVLIMSNRGFDNIHQRISAGIDEKCRLSAT